MQLNLHFELFHRWKSGNSIILVEPETLWALGMPLLLTSCCCLVIFVSNHNSGFRARPSPSLARFVVRVELYWSERRAWCPWLHAEKWVYHCPLGVISYVFGLSRICALTVVVASERRCHYICDYSPSSPRRGYGYATVLKFCLGF